MSAQGAPDTMPTCDTCDKFVIWNKVLGWVHTREDWPNGMPPHVDPAKHAATAVKWAIG